MAEFPPVFVEETCDMRMSEEELLERNPWRNFVLDILYSTDVEHYVADADKRMVDAFNRKLPAGDPNRLVLNVPPEPWQGNPLRAKVIFLSLNPGYVPEVNCKLARLLQSNAEVMRRMVQFKEETLRLESHSFFPDTNHETPVGSKDAICMLGDWYWERGLRELRESVCGKTYTEAQFYEDVAIMQYHAYSSVKCQRKFPPSGTFLPSQIYTRDLIEHICQTRPGTLFVIMRSKNEWEKLLSANDLWNRITKVIKDNKGMCQAISRKNLLAENGDDQFETIREKLLERT